MEDIETGAPMGGEEGGGYSGEGGAGMRPLGEAGAELDRGDSAFGEIPPYTMTDVDKGGGGMVAGALLLLLVVIVLYMAYR